MDGMNLMILGFQFLITLLLLVMVLMLHRRVGHLQHSVRDELDAINTTLAKLMTESETGYYDLLQTIDNVDKGVKKTAGLVLTHSSRETEEPLPQMTVLDKKHLATALLQQGLTQEEIAGRLDIPIGELALMLRMSEPRDKIGAA